MALLLALFFGAMFSSTVLGLPTGPPIDQFPNLCVHMMPTGHGPSSAVGPAPYSITTSADNYTTGGSLTVTINSDGNGTIFRGFFIQARRNEPGSVMTEPIGTFTNVPSGTQALQCNSVPNSAWGHSDNSNKTMVSATWNAPMQGEGDIEFRATIVVGVPDFSYYYTGVTSLTLNGPPRAGVTTGRPLTTSGGSTLTTSFMAGLASMGCIIAVNLI